MTLNQGRKYLEPGSKQESYKFFAQTMTSEVMNKNLTTSSSKSLKYSLLYHQHATFLMNILLCDTQVTIKDHWPLDGVMPLKYNSSS